MPLLTRDSTPSEDTLKRIGIKYCSDDHELREFLAHFHRFAWRPSVVILDDFSSFFSGNLNPNHRTTCIARTMALLVEAMRFARQAPAFPIGSGATSTPHRSLLLLSETTSADGTMRNLYIYNHWVALAFAIQEEDGALALRVQQADAQDDTTHAVASFAFVAGAIEVLDATRRLPSAAS